MLGIGRRPKLGKEKIKHKKARIQIWLFEQKNLRIEGRIIEASDLKAKLETCEAEK
ncbi:small nuclear ribonucleoprotein E-like [Senna tora]|uniref:Small nuclear ribonucleoprotein E-like n=1 Tax=Senna tora TaxID=362788 RepID=A0A834TFK7_9FABA|nr:small nuclear ribonucleoprotein E-like [Senna tora]